MLRQYYCLIYRPYWISSIVPIMPFMVKGNCAWVWPLGGAGPWVSFQFQITPEFFIVFHDVDIFEEDKPVLL